MGSIKVLIADDVQELRQLLRRQISRYNCEVIKEIADGAKVIDAIKKNKPDIIFLDINMPGKNGLDILKEVSEHNLHNKIWIISADDDQETIKMATEYGAMGYITKPFSVEELQKVFEHYKKISGKPSENNISQDIIKVSITGDESSMQDLLEKVLVKYNCEICAKYSSGNETIKALEKKEIPEILFLDIDMPDGTGLDVLKFVTDHKLPTFNVIVSAHGTFENIKTVMDAGADGFIVKPYSDSKIEQIIRKYIKSKTD